MNNQVNYINIGNNQRLTRKIAGVVSLIFAIYFSVSFIFDLFNNGILYITSSLYVLGILLIFEAKNAVCIGVAIRDREAMEGWLSLGDKKINDKNRSSKIRKIVRNLFFQSLTYSFIITSVIMMIKFAYTFND